MNPITQHLREEVYPHLDAVAANLLDIYEPGTISSAGSYVLKCPNCGAREAYYFPQSPFINCPRGNKCGVSTSVFDAVMESNKLSNNGDTYRLLCEAAGIKPLEKDKDTSSGKRELWRVVRNACIGAAKNDKNKHLVDEYLQLKNLTKDQFEAFGYGLFPSAAYMLKVMSNAGYSEQDGIDAGILPEPEKRDMLRGALSLFGIRSAVGIPLLVVPFPRTQNRNTIFNRESQKLSPIDSLRKRKALS